MSAMPPKTADSHGAASGLTVRAAAERLGVTPRTLKYYEELGLIHPGRSGGRYRIYDQADLARFARILDLRAIGFSLHAITEILKRPLEATDGGRARLSEQSLTEIQQALQQQVQTLDDRIASVRRELEQAQAVRRELQHDLAYVDGRLAGHPIDELLEKRRAQTPPQGPRRGAGKKAA